MLALFAVLRAMLYPGERVGIMAPTFRQAKFVFAEIEKMYEMSPDFREACQKPPVKAPESCYVKLIGHNNRPGSLIEALPLGDGGKIRGARYFTIICDELAQIPSEILDVVIRGMMATSKDPMENVRRIEQERKLVAEGRLERVNNIAQHRLVFASTAYYQYNHFWERVSGFAEIFAEKKKAITRLLAEGKEVPPELQIVFRGNSPNDGQIPHRVMMDEQRCLLMFNKDDPPEGFMNQESIAEAQRDMSNTLYRMEYMCYFPADSDGFFQRSLLDKARQHRQFSCHTSAINDKEVYIMGIDPARSGDNFAIAIVRVLPEARQIDLVRVLTYNKKSFPIMHHEIRKLVRLYNISEIAMDSGGGGTTIRDLLADKNSCPAGEPLILQRNFDEHQYMKGRRILELVEFSRYDWVHDANHNLLSALQHGSLRIASPCPCNTSDIWTQEKEDADEQIDKTIEEIQNIVVTLTQNGRMHWDTPVKNQRKDRYTSVLIAHYMAHAYLEAFNKPISLVSGFWRR